MKVHIMVMFAVFCLLLPPFSAALEEPYVAKVVEVTDGDTLTIRINGSRKEIRLWGVDTPEKDQPYGQKAREFTADLCLDKEVLVYETGDRTYGRYVGRVIAPNGLTLGAQLLAEGYAWWYKTFDPNNEFYERLVYDAKEDERGLWADDCQIPPWDWREGERCD